MSNAVANISAALGYDAVESMLASGRPLSDCYAFAAVAFGDSFAVVDCDDSAPESANTVAATVRPGTR